MNNQEPNSRTMEKSTRSCCGRCNEPYGYAFNALSKIWLALAVGFLLFPGVARAQQYVFEDISFPGDTFTQLLGINDADVIAGYHGQATNQGFILTLGSPDVFTPQNFPDSAQTQVTGINNIGNTSGFYIDNAGTNHGFLNMNGVFSTVDFPGTTFNQVLGLNNTGQAAGYFQAPSGAQTPFIFRPFLPPGGQFTIGGMGNLPVSGQATGINDQGQVSGFFPTATGDDGFLLSAGKLTTLSFPGATVTEALGLNNLGQVVGSYTDAMGNVHGFIYSNGVFTALNVPGAPDTIVNGINNFGIIVGFTQQSPNGNTAVGFVGAPLVVPEPSLLSLLALGSTALVGMCILRSRRSLR
jgi:probable HAF family extracellular repeat protein